MSYYLVIDMNKYAGDFEREMCAYLTGRVNPGTVLLDEAEMFLKKHPANDRVIPNENNRVVELSQSSNKWDNGSGFVYRAGEESVALAKYQEYMNEYKDKAIKVLDRDRFFMGEDAYEEEIVSLNLQVQDAMNLKEPIKSRVKHSIVIYFSDLIEVETFEFLLSRAQSFCAYYDEGIEVEGVYFLSEADNSVVFEKNFVF